MTSMRDFYQEHKLSESTPPYNIKYSCVARENVTKILATLVPDEIIYLDVHLDEDETEFLYNGVLFFADVSGFTDLCEKYNKLGKGGPSRITQVLNQYIGAMVQEIMSHSGDILKFSGDAFLALWKSTSVSSMSDVVHTAIDCALGIQRSHGQYVTEVGITLRVKIALAAGQVIFNVIGDETFMILGNTMFDVKDVGNMCSAGETIMSSSIKKFIGLNQYILNPIAGTQFIKIMGIGPGWAPSFLNDKYDIFDFFPVNENAGPIEDSDDLSIITTDDLENYSYSVRPSLNYAISKNLQDYLRRFIIAPVVRAVDLGEPLEYLTEMRQVVIVFVNIVTKVYQLKELEYLCDLVYRAVCDLVRRVGGCVNKVSMFDKDLMFLSIFGLRGFKHSVEAQRALYCAKKIREKMLTINQIASASAGVTTGATYCGVVGHQLRKEYTVIGRTVNKAARLMVAYPDMVTCDRQTFLQSQLQSRYFKLQPFRYLKGFKNVGPVYQFHDEFDEQKIFDKELDKTNKYPLLDRQKEIKMFFTILNMKISNSAISLLERKLSSYNELQDASEYCNMLIIKGESRQGKTRLLKEFGFYMKGEVAHLECSFNMMNAKAYKIFRCLFNNGCQLKDEKNIHTRTKNVWRVLHPFKAPEFLCALNEMLNVRFRVSKYYVALSRTEKLYVKAKMVKYLIRKLFKYVTVLIIDNIEYMDGESWLLLREVIYSEIIFTCATLHKNMNLGAEALKVIENPKITTITLGPVNQWYHAGLICQFLNCRGVSLELEKYIQEHSYGNPGWIESFLKTLLDSEGLEIVQYDVKQAYEQGLVMPNIDILERVSNKIESVNQSVLSLIESKLDSFIKLFDVEIEGWDIYEQTIPETQNTKTVPKMIPICVLSDEIDWDALDTEDFMDVKMLKSYDSLTVAEQQLLKGCSILGDSFERSKLEYIMQNNKQRENAIAIQKLFEIRIFACARGIYNGGAIKINHYLTDPNENLNLECNCKGFPVNPLISDLPHYASCGYIRFCEPIFREMMYHLLTDIQANMYHVRAMWFLESQTRRCRDCGNGYFVHVNGQNYDDGMKKYSQQQRSGSGARPRSLGTLPMLFDLNSRTSKNEANQNYIGSSAFGYQMKITDEYSKSTFKARTFAENNLVHCECLEILSTMYTQMIDHSAASEKHETLLFSLLEFAALCINFHNVTVAFTLLRRAIVLLEEKLKGEFLEPAWQVPITKGHILTLQGQLHIQREAYGEAETSLLESLNCYNLTFPTSTTMLNIMIRRMELKQKFILKYAASSYIGSKNNDVCTLAERTTDVILSLYTIYKRGYNYRKAYLASLWSFTAAIRSDSNFYLLCIAYGNIIKMDMIYSRPDLIYQIEDMALVMCYKKNTRLEIHELNALLTMYSAIFYRKCICDNMLNYLKLGYIIMNLYSPEYGNKYWWPEMPLLIRALIYTFHINQAATYIKIMWECQNHSGMSNENLLARMRIAGACLEFKLSTSYSVVPMSQIKQCAGVIGQYLYKKKIGIVEMQYYVVLWLWFVRKNEWQNSFNIYGCILNNVFWPSVSNHHLAFTYVSVVEGFLLLAVRRINNRDHVRAIKFINRSKKLLKQLKTITTRLKSVRPRYLLMEAYLKMIYKRKQAAFKILNEAKMCAIACSSLLDVEWIDHNKQEWIKWPKQKLNCAWDDATEIENTNINWESASVKNIPYYTLKLPNERLF